LAVSCPRCGAAVASGMRRCQFCGTAVEFVEPAAEANPPAETPFQETAQESAAEKVEQETSASGETPVPSAASAASASYSAEEGTRPESETSKPVPAKPNRPSFSCAAPAFAGLFVIVLLLFLGYRVLPTLMGGGPLTANGTTPRSSTHFSSGVATAAELGVDVYPGAQPSSAADRRDSTGSTVVSQSFVSNDRMDLVINFYKARMVGQASIYASGNGVVVSISTNSQDLIQVAIAPGPGAQTRIVITHTTTKG
jgi:hypothetical protein